MHFVAPRLRPRQESTSLPETSGSSLPPANTLSTPRDGSTSSTIPTGSPSGSITTDTRPSGETFPTSIGTVETVSPTVSIPPSRDPLALTLFDERDNAWHIQRFNASGSAIMMSRGDALLSTLCPQESLAQTGLSEGRVMVLDLWSATLMLDTDLDFELFIYAPLNATANIDVLTDIHRITLYQAASNSTTSCPVRLTRESLGIASGSVVQNITLTPTSLGLNTSATSLWVFNSTIWSDGLATSLPAPVVSSAPSASGGRGFDWAFVAIPLAIACALVFGLFAILYERKRRNGGDSDWFHSRLISKSSPTPDLKFSDGGTAATLPQPPSALSLKTGFKFGSAGDNDPRTLDRRSSSPLVASPLLAMPSPVAWSPASPRSATSISFLDPFGDRHGADARIHDMGSLYAASEFIRSSSHDPSSRRSSAAFSSQDLQHQSELRRGSATSNLSGVSSGYESYVTDQMTLVSQRGRRRSGMGSLLRKG